MALDAERYDADVNELVCVARAEVFGPTDTECIERETSLLP